MTNYNYKNLLPLHICHKYQVFVLDEDQRFYHLVYVNELDDEGNLQIKKLLRQKLIKSMQISKEELEFYLTKYELQVELETFEKNILAQIQSKSHFEESQAKNFFNFLASKALDLNASDIHLEPKEKFYSIRFRVDGVLQNFCKFNSTCMQAVITLLKLFSKVALDVHKSAQDGSFAHEKEGVDFRLSFMPLAFGTSVVCRILKSQILVEDIRAIGFDATCLKLLENACLKSAGLVLISGPTGSGKSSSLYAILNTFKDKNKKILTIEDPIELKLENLDQIALNAKANFLFDDALKAVLRHDPDIIMIGEIRDSFSLDTALKAANTGHLVFTTIHTNDALLAINRFLDMGAHAYALESSLSLIIAQRLVRKLCKCKEKVELDTTFEGHALKGTFYQAKGCKECLGSGYKGRMVVAEFVEVDYGLKRLIAKKATYDELLSYALKRGFKPLLSQGITALKEGLIDIDECKKSLVI